MADETEKETTAEKKGAEKKLKITPPRSAQKCTMEGCKRPYRAKGYCVVHYNSWRRGEMENHHARYKLCSKEACKKVAGRWGLCDEHGKKEVAAEAAPAA